MDTALFALLHVLVFVYWLGGDLGAFYASRYLTRPTVNIEKRLLAAKIVGDVDMAPRTALIAAFPTGLALAVARGWIVMDWIWVAGIAGFALAWLALAWGLHLRQGAAAKWMAVTDQIIRYSLVITLVGLAGAAFAGLLSWPLFVSLKLVLLAGAIAMGLFIRRVLKPLGPALAGLAGSEAAQAEAEIARLLTSARPLVMVIWGLITTAAFLGLWTPIT